MVRFSVSISKHVLKLILSYALDAAPPDWIASRTRRVLLFFPRTETELRLTLTPVDDLPQFTTHESLGRGVTERSLIVTPQDIHMKRLSIEIYVSNDLE